MAVEIKTCQRQTVKLTLTHKELIELAFAKAQGIGNWKVADQSVTAKSSQEYNRHHLDILKDGDLTITLVLEAPVIS